MALLPPSLRTRRARLVMAALAVLLLLRMALPWALAAGIGWGGQRALGVPVSVANVDVGLLRGRFVVDDLRVAAPEKPPTDEGAIDPDTALLRFERLDLNLQWLTLLRGRLRLADLSLATPVVRIELDETGSPILPSPPPDAPADDEATEAATGDDEATEAATGDPQAATEEAAGETASTAKETSGEPGPAPEETPEQTAAAEETSEPEDGGGWPVEVDTLTITGLDLLILDGRPTPAVEFLLESLRLGDVAYDAAGLGLGAIGIDAPDLRLRRDFVLGRPARPARPEPEPEPEPAGEPTPFRMDELRIDRAEFAMLTDAGPVPVALEAEARDVTSRPGVRFPVKLHVEVDEGVIDLDGKLGVSPLAFRGRLVTKDLPFPPLVTLARPDLAGWVASQRTAGDLELDLRLKPEGEAPAGLRIGGTVTSDDLLFRDPESEDLAFGWKRFVVPIDEMWVPIASAGAPPEPVRVSLGAVRLESPRFTYRQPTTALDRLASPEVEAEGGEAADAEAESAEEVESAKAADAANDPMTDAAEASPASQPPAPQAPAPEPQVTVASFALTDGEIEYRDATLDPAYEATVRNLEATLRGLRLPEETVDAITVSATLPSRASLSLEGAHGARESNLALRLERLALTPFNPYATGVGYRIQKGQATLESDAERRGERWDLSNRLVLHELGVASQGGSLVEQVIGIPLDLATALLRDLQGDITLGVPVAFDRGELQVGIASVVRDAVRAAVAGAVTSPLKAMGAAFSFAQGGGLAVEPLAMEPGWARLDEAQTDEIEALADLLVKRPELGVRLVGGASPEDRDALALRILAERAAAGQDWPEVEDSGFFARRTVRGAVEDGETAGLDAEDQALLERYVQAVEVPPERFEALARERARAVAQRLVTAHDLAPDHAVVADETLPDLMGVRIDFEAL